MYVCMLAYMLHVTYIHSLRKCSYVMNVCTFVCKYECRLTCYILAVTEWKYVYMYVGLHDTYLLAVTEWMNECMNVCMYVDECMYVCRLACYILQLPNECMYVCMYIGLHVTYIHICT
jgi:hypothetical protein